jgi:hypothetical protein
MGEQMFMMSEVVGQPSVVSDDFVQCIDQIICERQNFIILEFLCEFPKKFLLCSYKIAFRLG